MSADFWAGYASGVAGIIVGNPLDIIKVRLQALPSSRQSRNQITCPPNFLIGTTAPILGYGALNALLFATYNRVITYMDPHPCPPGSAIRLSSSFGAGAVAGLVTSLISTPTELLKCRAQVEASPTTPISCRHLSQSILRTHGLRGLYLGGYITACRDSIGYAFYFWSYELTSRSLSTAQHDLQKRPSTASILLCGGVAGVVSWSSVFPLDAIKTRVQTHAAAAGNVAERVREVRVRDVVRTAYRNEGPEFFFRGWTVCSTRAFLVNAVQWVVYEWVQNKMSST